MTVSDWLKNIRPISADVHSLGGAAVGSRVIARVAMQEFLVFFVHRHFDFRYPELEALLTLQGIALSDCVGPTAQLPAPEDSPLLRVQLPSEEAAKFLSTRGILVKGVYEIWGHAQNSDYDALVASVAQYSGPKKQAIVSDANCSWRISVDAFGKKLPMQDQRERREKFSEVLPFAGPVQMKDAQETFLILEDIGVDEAQPGSPKQILFLREIAGSEKNRGRGGARDLVDQQTLKRRAYIGPTSMESEMALLMSNMGLVQPHDLVIDPFVGTGSVLIPCATHGAICFGTDIDIRVLLGTGVGVSGGGAPVDSDGDKRVNIVSNFKQYGLPLPELIRADNSLSPMVTKCRGYFDAVVCDPPYGIRAGARKSGRKRPKQLQTTEGDDALPPHKQQNYIPPTQPYAAEDVMNDLLEFSAQTLREGGRLVYLLPTTYEYTDADLPRHPHLHLIANSEQKLTTKYARRLITMEKRTNLNASAQQQQSKGDDASFANLREKILEQNRKRKSGELDAATKNE